MKKYLVLVAFLVMTTGSVAMADGGDEFVGGNPPAYDHTWFPQLPPVDITCGTGFVPAYDFGFGKYVCVQKFCGLNGCSRPPVQTQPWSTPLPPIDITCGTGFVPAYDYGFKKYVCTPEFPSFGDGNGN